MSSPTEGSAPVVPVAGIDADSNPGALPDEDKVAVSPHALPELQPDPRPPGDRAAMDLILDVPVDVTVELGHTSVPLEDVLKFGPGHVVRLAQSTEQPVVVKVNGRPIAEGEVVDLGDTLGVRITAILEPKEAPPGGDEKAATPGPRQ